MIEKLWCKLFGHDFRRIRREIDDFGNSVEHRSPSENCRNCGLTKEEIIKLNRR